MGIEVQHLHTTKAFRCARHLLSHIAYQAFLVNLAYSMLCLLPVGFVQYNISFCISIMHSLHKNVLRSWQNVLVGLQRYPSFRTRLSCYICICRSIRHLNKKCRDNLFCLYIDTVKHICACKFLYINDIHSRGRQGAQLAISISVQKG